MGTDTLLVTAVVDRAAELLADAGPPVVRLPALPYGHSPHHLFAAAVSLSAGPGRRSSPTFCGPSPRAASTAS